jgi:hypothetical protein
MNDQSQRKAVRSSAILTDAYVVGTILEECSKYDELVLLTDFTIGSLTNAEIKVEMSDMLYYNLAYDGQSANFTVGKTVTGSQSGAKGVIIKDTDGGATGTLVIQRTNTIDFFDDEAITDDNGTPGVAVVNGTLTVSDYTFHQVTAEIQDPTNSDMITILDTFKLSTTGKYRIRVPQTDRYIRISSKGTGTVTNSLLGIQAILKC